MSLHVGGVPEHFNLPWHWAWEHQFCNPLFPVFEWKSYPAGTGAMLKDLREKKLDLAILLTEGMVQDIQQGNPSRIIQFHVDSSLRWSIHVGAASKHKTVDDLKEARFAISRYKSGSHLMAYVLAKKWGRTLDDQKDFVLVENLEGARKALAEDPDLVFLWERFTTKHLVDSGEFNYLGDCYTPWPSFVIAAREEILRTDEEEVYALLEHINEITRNLRKRSDIIDILCRKYRMKEVDALEWFTALKWNAGRETSLDELQNVLASLAEFGLVDKEAKALDFFTEFRVKS
jgi:sulfonate transport system substrate-binding protein